MMEVVSVEEAWCQQANLKLVTFLLDNNRIEGADSIGKGEVL